MKKNMIHKKTATLLLLLCLALQACIDDAVQNFRTAEEDGITAFLEKDPGRYSEFLKLLKATGIDAMLNARGNYTCFVPVNEAVLNYYRDKNLSFEQLTKEEIEELVYYHIIRQDNPTSLPITSDFFPNGTIGLPNMMGKFLQTTFEESDGEIYVNQAAKVLILDQDREDSKIFNGVVHTIDKVLLQSQSLLSGMIASREEFSLFAEALKKTGLIDSLEVYINEEYDRLYKTGVIPPEMVSFTSYQKSKVYQSPGAGGKLDTPSLCNIGFTVLMESDSILRVNHIETLEQLRQYAEEHVVPKTPGTYNDMTNRFNSLNRFIAYHILNKTMDLSDFIPDEWLKSYYTKDANGLGMVVDYSETLDPYGIVEIRRDANGPMLNRRADGSSVRILRQANYVAENGMIHGLDGMLTYDDGVENDVLNKRLRIDVTSLVPELQTNRFKGNDDARYVFPIGYLKNFVFTSNDTQVQYGMWSTDLQHDEILIGGQYDVKLRLPPVPEGAYEIRMAYTSNSYRAVAQIYLDGIPLGIPLDTKISLKDPAIGYVTPGDNEYDLDGVENDKMMRNRGYMKGPNTILYGTSGTSMRMYSNTVRRILVADANLNRGEHWLRFKSVEKGLKELMIDFIELVPSTAYIPKNTEDIN